MLAIISWVYFELEEGAKPLRDTSAFWIESFDQSLSKDAAFEFISEVADANHINIYKMSYGQGEHDRRFFEFIGNMNGREQLAPGGKYRDFDPRIQVTFQPASELTDQDIRGVYVVDDLPSRTSQSLADLRRHGFGIRSVDGRSESVLSDALNNLPLLGVLVVLMICCVLVVAYASLVAVKSYAVRLLHGFTRLSVVSEGVLSLAITYSVAIAVVVPITALYSWRYNDMFRFWPYLQVFALCLAVLLLVLVVVGVSATVAALPNEGSRYLKGAQPVGKLFCFAIFAKVAVLVTILVLALNSAAALSSIAELDKASEHWRKTAQHFALSHAGTVPFGKTPERKKVDGQIRAMFAYLEQQGAGMLVAAQDPRNVSEVGTSKRPDLIVDNNYLRENCILDINGNCVRDVPMADLQMVLLIPESRKPDEDRIVQSYAEFVAFHQQYQGTPISLADIKSVIRYTKKEQEAFSYRVTSRFDDPFVRDPVIMVADANVRLLSDTYYAAKSTTAEVIFTDSVLLDEAIKRYGVDPHIQYSYSLKDQSLQQVSDLEHKIFAGLAALVIIGLVGLVTAGFMAALYCVRYRKINYLREIHGYTFFGRHRHFAAGLGLVAIGILFCVWLAMPGFFGGFAAVLGLGIIGMDALLTVGFVALYETRARVVWLKEL